MYELKVLEGLDFKYLVNPEIPEIWRVDSTGNRRKIKSCKQKSGYEVVSIKLNGKSKLFYTHRIVWMAVTGQDIPKGYQVNHKDYNRGNNKFSNLEILTIRDNLHYSNNNRLMNRARRIALYKEGILVKEFDSHKELCEYTGIESYQVSAYLKGKSYKDGVRGYTFKEV